MDALITEALQKLFSKWIASDIEKEFLRDRDEKYFVKDGIIDKKSRWGKKKKILFVLKEPGAPLLSKEEICSGVEKRIPKFMRENKVKWDEIAQSRSLCKLFSEGNGAIGSFNSIARWAYVLQNINHNPSYETADKQKNDAFLCSAIMNLKKIPPEQDNLLKKDCWACNNNNLRKYVQSNKEYIKEEIRIINPEIIVCCGTSYFLKKEVFSLEEKSINICITDEIKGVLFIEICHPQAGRWKPNGREIRSGAEVIYEGLMQDYQGYLEKGNNG